MRLPQPPLLLVTDRQQARRDLTDIVRDACAAGCRWVSLREKDLVAEDQRSLFGRLLPIVHAFGGRMTLHGSAELARLARADGVHLSAGGDAAAARATLGREALIGISVHRPAEAESLDPDVIDYAVAGPAYPTASKPGYGPALGPSGLAAICTATRVPVFAIGGIEAEIVPDVMSSGAAGIAVMGGVMRAADPGTEAERLLALLTRGLDSARMRQDDAPALHRPSNPRRA